jgi:biopolymer transport protein ExbB
MHSPKNNLSRARLILGALAMVLVSCTAQAWWNGDFTLRKKIVIDTSSSGVAIDGSIGTVPVLVRLHDGDFRFTSAKPDGSDIRFVAEDDKTPLSYHIEKFDALLDEALVWVKIPDLKAGTKTSIWLYYGNAGNPPKAEDTKGTYDADTVLVYHFSEHGQPAYDFTAGGNNALNAGTPNDSSLIGTGLRLDGKNAVTIPASPSMAWPAGGPVTLSCWVKFAAPQPKAVVFSREATASAFKVGIDNGIPYVEVRGGAGVQRTTAGAPIAAGTWTQIAVIASNSRVTLYIGGESYGALAVPLPGLDGTSVIGGDSTGASGFAGELEELEISKSARDAGAIKFAAASQGGDTSSKLLTFGEDEQQKSWLSAFKGGYVGVIIGSLSVDGWVVIGILGVMGVISWLVMIAKASYINKVVKANAHFLKEWSHVANDLSVLEKGSDAGENGEPDGKQHGKASGRAIAPLYNIYHLGVHEIQSRLSADQTADSKVLSARSIQAIRATLDGGLIRESQKLNNQMVLLTIAISGGPFLGLLGTVVGVMITFAAVAQAGDVNVNAIAPGIAAALAATVAGLAVAIPALFGYNYLLTRIKSVSTDMHVFIDEFVTKLAEFYSETAS